MESYAVWPLCLASFTIFPFGRLKYFFYMRVISCLINFFLTMGFKAPLLMQAYCLSLVYSAHLPHPAVALPSGSPKHTLAELNGKFGPECVPLAQLLKNPRNKTSLAI